MPAKESSVHSGSWERISSGTFFTYMLRLVRKAYCSARSGAPPLIPLITAHRSLSKERSW